MNTRFLIALTLCCIPAVAMAKPHVVITSLQDAVYANPDCKASNSEPDMCMTECEVNYPVIDGIEALYMQKALNKKFEQKAQAAKCEGEKVATALTDDHHPNSRSYTYELTLNDGKLLAFTENNYYYGSGAAHGLYNSNGIIIDSYTGKELTTADILDMSKLDALNAFLVKKIKKDDRVFDTLRKTPAENIPPFISDTKREFALVLSEDRGLYAVFSIYQIGPYASGEIDFKIPSKFVKDHRIKEIIDTLEMHDAQR